MAMMMPMNTFLKKVRGAQQPAHQVRQLGQHVRFTHAVRAATASAYTRCAAASNCGLFLKRVLDPARHVLDAVRQQIDSTSPTMLEITCGSTIHSSAATKQQRQQHRKRRGKKFCGAGSTAWIFYVFLQRGRKAACSQLNTGVSR